MNKLRMGDRVIVLKGRSRGVIGEIEKVIVQGNGKKVTVKGANLVSKTIKANPNTKQKGRIIEMESPIDISNVALVNPEGKREKIKIRRVDKKNKRFYLSTGELAN